MAEKFKNFYIDHISRQQNAHADAFASLTALLVLPAEPIERVLICSRDLYCCKFALENSKTLRGDLQVKEILETSTSLEPWNWRFSYIDFFLYGILPDDPKEATAIRRKAPRFYNNAITRILYRRSYDGILLWCLSHKEARRRSKKLMTTHVDLTNPDLSSEIGLEDLATIGQRWSLTPSPMLSDAMPVRFKVTSSIKHRASSSNVLFMAIWDMGNGCYRNHRTSNIQRTSLHLGHN